MNDGNSDLKKHEAGIQLVYIVLSSDMKPLFINYMDRKKHIYKHSGFWGQHRGQTTVRPTNEVHHKKANK